MIIILVATAVNKEAQKPHPHKWEGLVYIYTQKRTLSS